MPTWTPRRAWAGRVESLGLVAAETEERPIAGDVARVYERVGFRRVGSVGQAAQASAP